MEPFRERYGPWAFVAGASEGIGAEFARQIAAHGVHLVLVALEREPLEQIAAEIRAAHRVEVRTRALDLASTALEREVAPLVDDLEVGLLVYNAAACPIGRFVEQNLREKLRTIDVNCRAPVTLVHSFGARMAARGGGGIVLLSSMAGLGGVSMVATYAATKAFNLVLAESLWQELGPRGVDVLACVPGATSTPGYLRSTSRKGPRTMTPAAVVTEALAALGRQPTLVPGRSNRLASLLMRRILPRSTAIRLISKATERMYSRE
jgi:short-subunit dehydrogenase